MAFFLGSQRGGKFSWDRTKAAFRVFITEGFTLLVIGFGCSERIDTNSVIIMVFMVFQCVPAEKKFPHPREKCTFGKAPSEPTSKKAPTNFLASFAFRFCGRSLSALRPLRTPPLRGGGLLLPRVMHARFHVTSRDVT